MEQEPVVIAQAGPWAGWLGWVGRHPGLVLLGTLAVAILTLGRPHHAPEAAPATNGEDTPLFI